MSEVVICNKALAHLGEDPITSLDDPSKKAELCRLQYPSLRDAVIEARMWRFALIRAVSSTADIPEVRNDDPDYPQWGDGFVHAFPTNMLQVFRAYRDTTADKVPAQWTREGDYIVSESDYLYLWGVRRVTDTNKFSNLFIEVLAARLAADLAVPITHNRTLMADMWQLYNDKMSEAAVRDGQQGRSEKTNATTLTGARRR